MKIHQISANSTVQCYSTTGYSIPTPPTFISILGSTAIDKIAVNIKGGNDGYGGFMNCSVGLYYNANDDTPAILTSGEQALEYAYSVSTNTQHSITFAALRLDTYVAKAQCTNDNGASNITTTTYLSAQPYPNMPFFNYSGAGNVSTTGGGITFKFQTP